MPLAILFNQAKPNPFKYGTDFALIVQRYLRRPNLVQFIRIGDTSKNINNQKKEI